MVVVRVLVLVLVCVAVLLLVLVMVRVRVLVLLAVILGLVEEDGCLEESWGGGYALVVVGFDGGECGW